MTTGKSTSGIWETPILENPTDPNIIIADIIIQEKIGLRIDTLESKKNLFRV
ncbi:hypothetical protein LEP1GSC171_1741 [Leptospira santarosai str. HAI1380]|uniref:Uncharacterized protein n=1 Tax=Leptospira santarosai str. MOR084 TaxID=1049984 RepID=A0A0E2BCG9_9LEPT|nr:hypothetical protein LEP1GSC179_3769 [Leptospira santarosai str. MOR084]EKR91190.1 hypothetical protein LEP1GSC163_3467 [Leptospira santarosai str. CBC379]EKS07001.1 hypothetical protein LEP1GSC071_1923 [Leptospira santarosai str. JET]EMF91937.1 hypothetical protein LEP1GSC005_3750 [Leptospira santarosai str. ST188]EMJ47903.1 hypothetical protein LEP1GSC169_2938 [Leptospira santarosai str. HAI1349]EMO70942.1 hypothetical protein LEP1GSC130_1371 [Leptospira santarosai str. 200403458]EMO9881